MHYRKLGHTGLTVSEIGLGCEGFAENDYQMTYTLLDAAEKAGVNYFDVYASDPQMRAAIGKALADRRKKFYIQSHISSVWKNGQYLRTRNFNETKASFEESLRLFGTDYIDVGMIHYCDALSDWQKIVDNGIPETVREHYKALPHHAGECVVCGACEARCPFGVAIRQNMKQAEAVFGY